MKVMGIFTLYVVRTCAGTLYVGQTNNLAKRLLMHKQGKGAKYLRRFDSFELVYSEIYKTRSEAMKREAQLKKMKKGQKERLVNI